MAAAALEIRFERIEGRRRRSRIVGNVELVILRRATGEVLARGEMNDFMRVWFSDVVEKDLRRLDEPRFLARWGDPKQWDRLDRTWPPRDGDRGRIPAR